MDADQRSEEARAVWQEQPSEMALDEIEARAAFLHNSFGATIWVPWFVTALLAVCFGLILLNAETWVARAGAGIGIVAALYFIVSALRLIGRPIEGEAPCVRVYAAELRRQHDALQICAITIVLVMTGAALASIPSDVAGWKRFLGPSASLLTGLGVAAYVHGQARRYAQRAIEVARLETRSD
jgi:hypothetical protein